MTRSSYTTNYTISYLNLYNKKILNIKKHITIFISHNTKKKNIRRSILIVSTIIYIKKLNKILYPTYIYIVPAEKQWIIGRRATSGREVSTRN